MKKIVLIDGNAIIHRSYHALPKTLKNAAGQLTNAVHGFTGILLGILEVEQPEYIATAWDMKGPTFRDAMMTTYKATRAKTDDELIAQFPMVYGVLEALNIPQFKKEGLEADDYLGILASEVERDCPETEILIVTSDRDALQLVNERTTVVAPISGYSKVQRYDRDAVKAKLGVWPEQVPDYKGLCGDSSDNIPGVPGVGAKTAVRLLEQFSDLDALYEGLAFVERERVRNLLTEHEEQARLSKQVATILREDEDLEFSLRDCELHDFDIEAVRTVFETLSFRSHLRRVEGLKKRLDEEQMVQRQESLF